MSETTKQPCRFKSEHYPEYKCTDFALKDSQKENCIFHEPRADKDIAKFNKGIKDRLGKHKYDFMGYWFPEGFTLFRSHRFEGKVNLGEAFFEGEAHLGEKALFKGGIDFSHSTVKRRTYFGGSTFEGPAEFVECIFREPANFAGATFGNWANFEKSVFKAGANFEGCVFSEWANFLGVSFKKQAKFANFLFEDWTRFGRSIFHSWANFGRVNFEAGVDFIGSSFEDQVNFIGTTFKELVFSDNVKIKKATGADVFFREVKILWHGVGHYVEEGKYHYQEMDYIRKQQKWYVRYVWANLLHKLLHGYGEKPLRVIGSAAGIIIGCALLFMHFGIGETSLLGSQLPKYSLLQPSSWETIGKVIALKYFPSTRDWANVGRYFYFSVVTFTTLGYGDLRPVHPISHLISSIEAFVGMFTMALFVLTFGRKWRR